MQSRTRRGRLLILATGGVACAAWWWAALATEVAAPPPTIELAMFTADITPAVGAATCIGYIPKWTQIERPLLAKGVMLRDRGGVTVLCALDLCGVCNGTYDRFRAAVAKAAGTDPSRVIVHSLHQHTAPTFDADAVRLLYAGDEEAIAARLDAIDQTIEKVCAAIPPAAKTWKPLSHFGVTVSKAERVASSRRLLQPDDSIVTRLSRAQNDEQMQAPEGLIDPDLRTVTLFDGEAPLACLHFYASHPQTYPSAGLVTDDVPGMAREELQAETGVFQMYLTGCGGNVAMGKYNDGTPERRAELLARLHDAMRRGFRSPPKRFPATMIEWRTVALRFPPRRDAEFTEAAARRILADQTGASGDRIRAAFVAAWTDRIKANPDVPLHALVCGPLRMAFLPGEPFVEYQLAAQRSRPDHFVAVAGYTDCGMWYIGTDRIYTDRGGYEQSYALAGPVEANLKGAIAKLME